MIEPDDVRRVNAWKATDSHGRKGTCRLGQLADDDQARMIAITFAECLLQQGPFLETDDIGWLRAHAEFGRVIAETCRRLAGPLALKPGLRFYRRKVVKEVRT